MKRNKIKNRKPDAGSKPTQFAIPLLLLALFFLLALTSCQQNSAPLEPQAPGPEIDQPYNVLVLSSYHSDFPWSADISDGIHTAFDNSEIHPEVFIEYMDTKRYTPEEIFPSLVAMYSSKYENTPLDLIIVVDNNALSFVATYYEQIFQDVPIIFVGINEFSPEMLGSISEVTGIIESPNVEATIDLILTLQPETKHLISISDNTLSGKIHQAQVDSAAQNYAGRLELINFVDLSIDEMLEELSNHPEDTAILYLSYFRTSAGDSLTVEESLQLIHENSTAPIFSTWDFIANTETVGGALLTGKSQGIAAGNLAIQVLTGTPASRLPIVQSSPTEIILNYPELLHHDIPLSAVPAGSTIINRPQTFYSQYKTIINITLFFLIAQYLIIIRLVRENRRRRIAEKELAAAENRLDRMLQTIVDGVLVLNKDYSLAYANGTAREIFDIPTAAKYGEHYPIPPWVFLDENDEVMPRQTTPLSIAIHQGIDTHHKALRLRYQNGDIKWLLVSASPLFDQEGKISAGISSVTDITSQQLAMEALQKSEKRFRTLFEQVVDAIIICELDGQILDVNQRACDMLAYSHEELLKRSAFDITARINKENMLANWKNLSRGDISSEEGYHLNSKEEPIPVELSVGLIELEGLDRILIVSRDITERHQARQILLEERSLLEKRVKERTGELQHLNAELKIAARAKDDFLANMSHELRTPLNAVLGMSEMLGEELHGPLNDRQHKYIKTIESSGHHLLDLINDILDLSKIEAGQKTLEIQPVEINDLCRSSLFFTQQLAEKKNIHTNFEHLSKETSLHADPRSIKQIIVNLLSNAIKFSPDGGTIEFTVEDVPQKHALRFSIKDYGIGIAPEMMPRLFKPFFQIDSSLSRNYEGTGLGLALVSRLVAMHSGTTSLESTGVSGEGSTFTVTLPLDRKKFPEYFLNEWKEKHDQFNCLTGNILLAEDDEVVVQNLRTVLLPLGCDNLEVARSGTELLDQARENPPDIILLNMQIPDMDGWQILSILKADKILRDIPVICMTSLYITGDKDRYTEAGASQFCCKPFCLKKIVEFIAEYSGN